MLKQTGMSDADIHSEKTCQIDPLRSSNLSKRAMHLQKIFISIEINDHRRMLQGLLKYQNMNIENILPILCATGSTLSYVSMQVFVRYLSQQISTQYILYMRSVILLILNSIFIYSSFDYQPYESDREINKQLQKEAHQVHKYFSLNIKNTDKLILMIKRQFWAALSINCFLSSLKYIPISIANTLMNTSPVLIFFIEAAFYKKAINKNNLLIACICFIGVLIMFDPITQFTSDQKFNWYLLFPLAAAAANSVNWLYLHQMRNMFSQILILQYAYIFQLLSSGILVNFAGNIQSQATDSHQKSSSVIIIGMIMLIIAILAYIAHFLRIKAIFMRKPSQILVYNYSGIIYSIILDMVLFNNQLQWYRIIGIILTSIGLLSHLLFNSQKKTEK